MSDGDFSVKVGAIELKHPLMNGPGPRKSVYDMHELASSNSAAIVWGSITPEQRSGNPEPRYSHVGEFALNSIGLENIGWGECLKHIKELQAYDKPLWLSIAEFSMNGFLDFISEVSQTDFEGVLELNLSCPNIGSDSIIAYDDGMPAAFMQRARRVLNDNVSFGVKLNYHPENLYIESMVKNLSIFDVDFVVLGNTVPNALALDPETLKPVTRANGGLAGLSGRAVKPLHLGLVRQFRRQFDIFGNDHIKIVGLGGIESGQDMLDYMIAGADLCQVATLYGERGPAVFDRILAEFFELMNRHGFSSVEDIFNRRNQIWA